MNVSTGGWFRIIMHVPSSAGQGQNDRLVSVESQSTHVQKDDVIYNKLRHAVITNCFLSLKTYIDIPHMKWHVSQIYYSEN